MLTLGPPKGGHYVGRDSAISAISALIVVIVIPAYKEKGGELSLAALN